MTPDHPPHTPPSPAVTSVRPIASRPGWVWVCVDRARRGAISAAGASALGIAPGAVWTASLADAFRRRAALDGAIEAATAALARREHSAARVLALLRALGHGDAAARAAVEHLQVRGLIDDARAAAADAERSARRGLDGSLIEAKLRLAGHDAAEAARATREVLRGTDPIDRACQFLQRRMQFHAGRTGADPARRWRRLYALLVRNGFEDEVAQAALERTIGLPPSGRDAP